MTTPIRMPGWAFDDGVEPGAAVDLLGATAALVDIASVSHNEADLADHVEARLRAVDVLDVTRLGHTVVARTDLGLPMRLALGGHLDTVPPSGNERAVIEGTTLRGIGAADMKGGLAVFLHLAESLRREDYGIDVTYFFYDCEEVASVHNGLRRLFETHPELLAVDAAVLGEPTCSVIEAGCQGTLRVELTLRGARAHSARPWMGRNAIHRLAGVLDRVDGWEGRLPLIDGCRYREALQAVLVRGGVATNVVPDEVTLTLNLRYAPDCSAQEAIERVRAVVGEEVLADEATLTVVDNAPGAMPSLTHPLLEDLLARTQSQPVAKLGWTDVAFFAAQGIPAVNYGPGDPTVAHTANELVEREEIEAVARVLRGLLTAVR